MRRREFLLLALAGVAGMSLGLVVSRLPARAEAMPMASDDTWCSEAIGSSVSFPASDSFGRKLEPGKTVLLIVVACSSCAKDPLTPDDVPVKMFDTTVVAFDGAVEEVPQPFEANSRIKVLAGDDLRSIPISWRIRTPQIFLIREGKVTDVPPRGVEFKEFLHMIAQDH